MITTAAIEDFRRHGFMTTPGVLSSSEAAAMISDLDIESAVARPGRRLGAALKRSLLDPTSALGRIASSLLGDAARPVRALLFDKSPSCNWAVPWHQDRTIAVTSKLEAPGFGPWSTKDGVQHVEPPFDILAGMVSLRLHLDPCDAENGPLAVAPGSHCLGRIPSERAAPVATEIGPVTCLADVGDVLALSTPILHASPRAVRPRRRRVLQVDYAAIRLPGGLEWVGA